MDIYFSMLALDLKHINVHSGLNVVTAIFKSIDFQATIFARFFL